MDPHTLIWLAEVALQQQRTEQEADNLNAMRASLLRVESSLASLLEAPFHEGLAVLSQARVAEGETRRRLLERSQEKFSDASARADVDAGVKCWAKVFSAWCWVALGEPPLAEHEVDAARDLAEAWRKEEELVPLEVSDLPQDPPRWMVIDEVADVSRYLDEFKRTLGANVATFEFGSGEASQRLPAPAPGSFETLGRPEELNQVWHSLRLKLWNTAPVQWYATATDLRLLGTTTTLYVWHPKELLARRLLRFSGPLQGIQMVRTGREWFDSFIILRAHGEEHRINAGPEDHARTLTQRLSAAISQA